MVTLATVLVLRDVGGSFALAVGVGVPPVSGSVKAVWPRIVAPRAVPAA